MINEATKQKAIPRLKRIEGQIRGIARMVENEIYCIDVINQINAVRRALEGTALILMRRHMESCLTAAIQARHGSNKIRELLNSINAFVK